jgi:putative Mn2+ efflux pump MntP
MDVLSIILLAVGLAMDCCAVSVVQGLTADIHDMTNRPRPALMACIFGLFHTGMPVVGFYAGSLFTEFMQRYAPWIALVILGFLGVKMIWESYHEHSDATQKAVWSLRHLLMLALATSVDVLATGVLFIPYPEQLWWSVLMIGAITAVFSIGGYLLGVFVGRLKINMELVGGLVLIGLGIKIWAEGFLN